MDASANDRERVLALLRRHGWNATSFQVLEPGFRYWFDGDACVAYVEAGGAWVAAGAPIAAVETLHEVAGRFAEAAAAARCRACFFATEERFASRGPFARLCIGEQPVWDPQGWAASALGGSRSLREQLRRSRAKGVVIRAVEPAELAEDSATRKAIDALVVRWFTARKMAPMGFLVGVELFGFASERRCFVAEREGSLVGMLSAVPIYARGGWLLEDLLRDPSAPNGTAELLVDGAMRALAASGSRYATLGLAPLAGEVGRWLRTAREWGRVLYDFDGVRAFKAKLRPDRWDPIYLAYPAQGRGTSAIYAALRAFAGGGLLRFGLQTVLRGPPVIVRLLAVLLIPWTLLLASVGPGWFPSRGVQAAWVAFDLALCGALWVLSRRWRSGLATALACVIAVDAALTLFQALTFNVHHLGGWPGALLVALGVLAPLLASGVLWGALSTRLRAHGP